MKRYRFLRWLRVKVFKVKEGEIAPRVLRIIYNILFPLNYAYEKQSNIKYNPIEDVYTIEGVKITGQCFRYLFKKVETQKSITVLLDPSGCVIEARH